MTSCKDGWWLTHILGRIPFIVHDLELSEQYWERKPGSFPLRPLSCYLLSAIRHPRPGHS